MLLLDVLVQDMDVGPIENTLGSQPLAGLRAQDAREITCTLFLYIYLCVLLDRFTSATTLLEPPP